jgi:NADH:ubiquinone oxidoreductase subunit 2 (subunit N)
VKLFTTACLIASVLLCFVCMMLLGHIHEVSGKGAKLLLVDELAATTVLMIFSVIGSAVGAIVIVRRARQLYREEATRNMLQLVEEARARQNKAAQEQSSPE